MSPTAPSSSVFTDRALRPGDLAFFDILHSFNGYRTCYYRTIVDRPQHEPFSALQRAL
jgi:hypothetical protein